MTFKSLYYKIWRSYTLVAYPLFIDIHVANHCNLNCKGCNHYSPIANMEFCNEDEIIESISKLKKRGILKFIKYLNLIGGEPLLYQNIDSLITKLDNILRGSRTKLRLITNGVLLNKMPEKFWEVIHNSKIVISVTRYPINVDYDEIEKFIKSKNINFEIFGDRSSNNSFSLLRLKDTKEIPENKILQQKYDSCFFQCMQLVGSQLFICPPSAYFKVLNEKFKTNFENDDNDYLDINNINILKFILFRLKAKKFCKYCQFPLKSINWDASQRKAEEWIDIDE